VDAKGKMQKAKWKSQTFAFCILHFELQESAPGVRRENQQAIAFCQWCGRIADKGIPVQVGSNRGMKTIGRYELAQGRAPRRQRSEKLAQCRGIYLEFRYTGTFSGNPQKLDIHGRKAG
jgi:hypothetical protein